MSDLRINGATVHVEGCLWASRRLGRPWLGSGARTREDAARSARVQGLTVCPDCRPLDTLPTTIQGGRRG